jgi:hypothetical protein
MPSLISCHMSLRSLTIMNNDNLTLLSDASLETCTALIDLSIYKNNNAIASNTPLLPTIYSNLKELRVSIKFCSVCETEIIVD